MSWILDVLRQEREENNISLAKKLPRLTDKQKRAVTAPAIRNRMLYKNKN